MRLLHQERPGDRSRSRRTAPEDLGAVQQFQALATPYRFRVQPGAEGLSIIPGRGKIESYYDGVACCSCALQGLFALAVYTVRPRLLPKIWSIPGVRRHQTGDSEMRAVLPVEALEKVAAVIRAHRDPGVTSAIAKNIGSRTAFETTSRPQEAGFEPRKGLGLTAGTRPERRVTN